MRAERHDLPVVDLLYKHQHTNAFCVMNLLHFHSLLDTISWFSYLKLSSSV
jgi:hypothetical protein